MSREREVNKVDLDTDRDASIARIEELRKGRNRQNIPMNDEYWIALKKHHNAHDPRTGEQ